MLTARLAAPSMSQPQFVSEIGILFEKSITLFLMPSERCFVPEPRATFLTHTREHISMYAFIVGQIGGTHFHATECAFLQIMVWMQTPHVLRKRSIFREIQATRFACGIWMPCPQL